MRVFFYLFCSAAKPWISFELVQQSFYKTSVNLCHPVRNVAVVLRLEEQTLHGYLKISHVNIHQTRSEHFYMDEDQIISRLS